METKLTLPAPRAIPIASAPSLVSSYRPLPGVFWALGALVGGLCGLLAISGLILAAVFGVSWLFTQRANLAESLVPSLLFGMVPLAIVSFLLVVVVPLAIALGIFGGERYRTRRAWRRSWEMLVTPGYTGPREQMQGYEVDVPFTEAAELGYRAAVRFVAARYRWQNEKGWELFIGRIGRSATDPYPLCEVGMDGLTEHWIDFVDEIEMSNRDRYLKLLAETEAQREAESLAKVTLPPTAIEEAQEAAKALPAPSSVKAIG